MGLFNSNFTRTKTTKFEKNLSSLYGPSHIFMRLLSIGIFLLVLYLLISCSSETQYLRIEKGFTAQLEVYGVKYIEGTDSAASVKQAYRYFDVELIYNEDTAYTIWQEQVPVQNEGDTVLSEFERSLQNIQFEKGVKVVYGLDRDGLLKEMYNWSEVKTFVDSLSEAYIQMISTDSTERESLRAASHAFNDQSKVESRVFKAIYLFHCPYGLSMDTTIERTERVIWNEMSLKTGTEKLELYQSDAHQLVFLLTYPKFKADFAASALQPWLEIGLPDSIAEYTSNSAFTDTIYVKFNVDKNHVDYTQFVRTLEMMDKIYKEIIEMWVY